MSISIAVRLLGKKCENERIHIIERNYHETEL